MFLHKPPSRSRSTCVGVAEQDPRDADQIGALHDRHRMITIHASGIDNTDAVCAIPEGIADQRGEQCSLSRPVADDHCGREKQFAEWPLDETS